MKFLTVLQTHSKSNSQAYTKRVCSDSKSEVTRRCVKSLFQTMNNAALAQPHIKFELQIFDDHSDPEILEYFNNLIESYPMVNAQVESLKTYGIMPSILRCYEHGKDYGDGLVYFAQDDYLFEPTAIEEMVELYSTLSPKLNNHVSVFPFNDPWRYIDTNSVEKVHMFRTSKRHWRSNYHCASCFMTHSDVIKDNWDLFYGMGVHPVAGDMEDNTINKLFIERGYFLMTPIPSLALHMQYDTEVDPFIDWREKWDKFADGDPTFSIPESDVVLNIGSSTVDLQVEFLRKKNVVTLDIDRKANPHIVGSITDMHMIPTSSVDVVWASHIVEHLAWHELPQALSEMYRVSKPDGYVTFAVPNLQGIGKYLVDGNILDTVYESGAGPIAAIDMIYGYRRFVQAGSAGMQHKTGFTPQSMKAIIESLKFNDYVIATSDLNIIVLISKTKVPDEHKLIMQHWDTQLFAKTLGDPEPLMSPQDIASPIL